MKKYHHSREDGDDIEHPNIRKTLQPLHQREKKTPIQTEEKNQPPLLPHPEPSTSDNAN